MKKLVKALCAVVFGAVVLAGCSTFTPIQAVNNVPVTQNVTVLGRVNVVEAKTEKSGYTLLMDEAKKQYPSADDILNILVDHRKGPGGEYYRMSAVVVKYN